MLSGSASCALPARYEAVRSAREFTRRTLRRWSLVQEYDTVALVVSELVTNALRHGLAPGDGLVPEPPVRLHLMRWSARLVCAVRDPSGEPPRASGAEIEPDPFGTDRADPGGLEGLSGVDGAGGAPRTVDGCGAFAAAGPAGTDDAGSPDNLYDLDAFRGFDVFDGCPESTAESGRGLRLVDSFSDCWGWHRLTGALPGKVVWALFRLGPV
nr:ATP-binding protein [Streptomyces sp. JJ36]